MLSKWIPESRARDHDRGRGRAAACSATHVVSLETRPPNIEGEGEVTQRDLLRNTLRMRPDRIIIGEVRGAETLDMLQAMNTGHEGSMTTVHANSARDALRRVENMVSMAGLKYPVHVIRDQMAATLDLLIHVGRLTGGRRKVVSISEVTGIEGDVMLIQDLFLFRQDRRRRPGPCLRALRGLRRAAARPGAPGIRGRAPAGRDVAAARSQVRR